MARFDPALDIANFGFEADASVPRWHALRDAAVLDPLKTAAALGWRLTGKRQRFHNIVRSIVGDRLKIVPGEKPMAPGPIPSKLPAILPVAWPDGMPVAAVNEACAASLADIVAIQRRESSVAPDTLRWIAGAFARDPQMMALYTDEIVALPQGGLPVPLYKPDYDEDMLLAVDYIGSHLAVRRDVFLSFGGLDERLPGTELRALLLAIAEVYGRRAIGHLAYPVYAWKGTGASDAMAKLEARQRCSEIVLKRQGIAASCDTALDTGIVTVTRALPSQPLVSVIVPTRDRVDLLRPCIEGLLQRTDYQKLEVVVADNGSEQAETADYLGRLRQDGRVTIVPVPGPFNYSRINNLAAASAKGEVLAFLNNDIEVKEPGWLKEMAVHALRSDIGAVGAKLLYPDGKIQHGGVVLGIKGIAAHAHQFFHGDHPGYMHRLRVPQHFSAVTAACLVVAKDKFLKAGGFDEEQFAVSLNDVDLCLKLEALGWRSLWTPRAVLLHKESASRRRDRLSGERRRWLSEVEAFKVKWSERLRYDPAYSVNFGHLQADFSVIPP